MRESPKSDRSPLRLVIAIGCIWLLSSVLFLLSASLDLILFSSFANTHFIFSFKNPLPTSSSAPHVQSCSASPPFPCSLSSTTSFPSTPHSTSTRFGWAGPLEGSPHSLLLVRHLSASGAETETTHSLCCGFEQKIFVKFLPVLAPCAAPSDWSANSPFCWQVTGIFLHSLVTMN